MEKQLEQEWKGRLSEQDFNLFLDYARNEGYDITEINQVNHYFDSSAMELMNHGAMLRIREKNGAYEATCKIAKTAEARGDGEAPSVTEEYTVSLDEAEAQDYFSGRKSWEKGNPLYDLITNTINQEVRLAYLGQLKTQRFLIDLNNGLEPICLDRSDYFGITDFELEWETNKLDKAHSLLKMLEEDLGITLDWNVMPKSARFFEAGKARGQ